MTVEDRRITNKLLHYWENLKDDRAFPSIRKINPKSKEIADIWNSCFIVEASNKSRKEDYSYKYIGMNIIKAYGKDLTGFKVEDVATMEPGHLADVYEKVLATKRPYYDEGEIQAPGNRIIKYRQILLPLGNDGVNIDSILGGMSYKVFDQ